MLTAYYNSQQIENFPLQIDLDKSVSTTIQKLIKFITDRNYACYNFVRANLMYVPTFYVRTIYLLFCKTVCESERVIIIFIQSSSSKL